MHKPVDKTTPNSTRHTGLIRSPVRPPNAIIIITIIIIIIIIMIIVITTVVLLRDHFAIFRISNQNKNEWRHHGDFLII